MTLPDHFFTSDSDGALHDTRANNWTTAPLRGHYKYHFPQIDTLAQAKATIRAGMFSWPGGYPLFFIADDGAPICFDCARAEFRQIASAFLNDMRDGWRIEACEINYEDDACQCANCSEWIPAAYTE